MAKRKKAAKRAIGFDVTSCAVREITADSINVSRCWHAVTVDGICPRHGDVRAVQEHYGKTGELTDERLLRQSRST